MQALARRVGNNGFCIGQRWVDQFRRITTGKSSSEAVTLEDDYRTQRKATYILPYYGASDEEIDSLSDVTAKQALKVYGGLFRKDDTGDIWRSRLRKLTRSWLRSKQLTISGVVVSDKMVKSVVVAAKRPKSFKKYEICYMKTRRFMAHDELNLCREGDEVTIRSCRPMSKRKAHVVVRNYGDKMRVGVDDRKIVLDDLIFSQDVAAPESPPSESNPTPA